MELSTYCLHESGWRFVTAPGEASLQCLPCCAQQLLDVRDVSWLRRSGLARALTEAIATVPRGAFRACSALPVWALVARALVAFLCCTPDQEAKGVAAQGVSMAMEHLSQVQSPDAATFVRDTVDDVLDWVFCSGSPATAPAQLGLLALLLEANPRVVGQAIAGRTGDLMRLLPRVLSHGSAEARCELLSLVLRLGQVGLVQPSDELFAALSQHLAGMLRSADTDLQCAALKTVSAAFLWISPEPVSDMDVSPLGPVVVDVASALKPLLLQGRSAGLRLAAAQCVARISAYSSATLQACLSVSLPDVLLECLVSQDELLLESVMGCLAIMSEHDSFFQNLVVGYAFQPLLACTAHLTKVGRVEAAVVGLDLLRRMFQKHRTFRASQSLVGSFVRHLDAHIKTGHPRLVLAGLQVSQEMFNVRVLPLPVPTSLLQRHASACLEALRSACNGCSLTDPGSSDQAPGLSQELPSVEARMLRAGLELLESLVEVYSECLVSAVAREASYSGPDATEVPFGTEDLVDFVFCKVVGLFLPHCKKAKWLPLRAAFLQCICTSCRVLEGKCDPDLMCCNMVSLLHADIIEFLWDSRRMSSDLFALTGTAFTWLLWYVAESKYRDMALLATLKIGMQYLPETVEEALGLLTQSHFAYSEVQLVVLMLCCTQWQLRPSDQDPSPSALLVSAVSTYATSSGETASSNPYVLRLLCYLVAVVSVFCSDFSLLEKLTSANTWLLGYLSRRTRWEDVLPADQTVLRWCLSSFCHQEMLGRFALEKWMDMTELPQDMLEVFSNSSPALKAILELLASEGRFEARRVTQFLKQLILERQDEPVAGTFRIDVGFVVLDAFAHTWLRREHNTTELLYDLLDMLTFCKADMPGLIKGELDVFQRVLQLDSAHDLEARQWSILLSYLLTVFRGSDSEVDSAASLLLSQPRWLESLETQLVEPGHVRATGFMVLQRLIDIQLRAHMPCGGAVLLEKRSLQSELHAGPEGGVVAAMALLRALLAQQLWPTGRGLAVRLKTPLSLADYSALLYTLAGHAAKINTAVDEPAVECLEVIFLFVDLVSDTDLVSRLAAHPWLNSVLLECRLLHAGPSLSITTLRIVLLVLQGAHTNQLIVEQLPFIVDCLSTQGKACISLSRRIAVKLLSGGYHRHLSEQSRGKLRHLLSPAEDADPVQQRQQQQQQQPRAILPA